jgi:hypothetical protein
VDALAIVEHFNARRLLRSRPDALVRSQAAAGARSVVRRTRIFLELEVRRLDCRHCGKVKRERLSGGQSALYQALCLLCRPSLPIGDD